MNRDLSFRAIEQLDSPRREYGGGVHVPRRSRPSRDQIVGFYIRGAVAESGFITCRRKACIDKALENGSPAPMVRKLELPALSDQMLGDYLGAIADERETLDEVEHGIKLELRRRAAERGGREIMHPRFEKLGLEDQFTSWVYDIDLLRKAQKLLLDNGKDEEAAKILRHVPENVTVIAAYDEAGNSTSIDSIIRRFGEDSEVGKLLVAARSRSKLEDKLVIKPRKAKP